MSPGTPTDFLLYSYLQNRPGLLRVSSLLKGCNDDAGLWNIAVASTNTRPHPLRMIELALILRVSPKNKVHIERSLVQMRKLTVAMTID
jgi:hypothetical protein